LDESTDELGADVNSAPDHRRQDKLSARRRRQASPGGNRQQDSKACDTDKPARDKDRSRTKDGPSKSSLQGRRSQVEEDREPAWMQTYDPEKDGKLAGVLGGDLSNGQLDSIQAWKQELKAQEVREKRSRDDPESVSTEEIVGNQSQSGAGTDRNGIQQNSVDEIAMFKMMMQREQSKGPNEHEALTGQGDDWDSRPTQVQGGTEVLGDTKGTFFSSQTANLTQERMK
jgi:hypothetical protein